MGEEEIATHTELWRSGAVMLAAITSTNRCVMMSSEYKNQVRKGGRRTSSSMERRRLTQMMVGQVLKHVIEKQAVFQPSRVFRQNTSIY